MRESATPAVELVESASAADVAVIEEGLNEHARISGVAPRNERPIHAWVRREDGAIIAGLVGRTVWGWLHVSLLWVSAAHRRRGYGAALLRAVEDEARRRGCRAAYLDTFDFQALPFYQRQGYRVFGRLADFPPGHERYFVEKTLAPSADA